jgi:hypothetical protein
VTRNPTDTRHDDRDRTQPASRGSAPDHARWHLTEVTSALRDAPAPLDPAFLGVVLRGLADLCWLLNQRGGETPARPPMLFRDNPVIIEALGMWATQAAYLAADQSRPTANGARRA